MTTGKGHEHALEFARIFSPLQREREQAQPGHPALCALLKAFNGRRGERKRERLLEKGAGFLKRKAQFGSVEFVQIVMGAQASQGQGWIAARQYYQAQHHRQVIDEIQHCVMNL